MRKNSGRSRSDYPYYEVYTENSCCFCPTGGGSNVIIPLYYRRPALMAEQDLISPPSHGAPEPPVEYLCYRNPRLRFYQPLSRSQS